MGNTETSRSTHHQIHDNLYTVKTHLERTTSFLHVLRLYIETLCISEVHVRKKIDSMIEYMHANSHSF